MEIINVIELLKNNPDGSFLELGSFNGKSFGTCSITSVSPGWEMHPDTDEFFYVIDGTVEITFLEQEGKKHYIAPTGSSFMVPKGVWHRPGAPNGARFIYFTPGQSLYSELEDPRNEADT